MLEISAAVLAATKPFFGAILDSCLGGANALKFDQHILGASAYCLCYKNTSKTFCFSNGL